MYPSFILHRAAGILIYVKTMIFCPPDFPACAQAHCPCLTQAVTVLRLARILNFMKSLLDKEIPLPDASSAAIRLNDPADRLDTGRQLLSKFLADGKICGVTPQGEVFDHHISEKLSRQFLAGLASIEIRGSNAIKDPSRLKAAPTD